MKEVKDMSNTPEDINDPPRKQRINNSAQSTLFSFIILLIILGAIAFLFTIGLTVWLISTLVIFFLGALTYLVFFIKELFKKK